MFGVHTALVTPFTSDDRLDTAAYEKLAVRQLEAGIHGLVPCGTTGEAPTLEDAEWKTLVAIAVSVAAGKVPVTAGVGTNATRSTVAKCEQALKLGANAGLLVFPYYNKPNAHGMIAHVKAAADVGLPLVLYHVPGRTAHRLSHELLAELASMKGVIAIKEATGDIRYGADVMRLTTTPVLSGDDFSFLGLMAHGGTGVISVVSNVDPRGTVAVYEHFAAGRTKEAQQAMRRIWDLCGFLFTDTNPVPAKAALAALGYCRPEPRLPLGTFKGPAPTGLLTELGLL